MSKWRSRRGVAVVTFIFVAAAVAVSFGFISPSLMARFAVIGNVVASRAPSEPAATPPVHVHVAPAKAQDVPIFLSGIGTVQALNTIALKPRVTGEIVKILFTEGQDVSAGTPLAIIDQRLYQAALARRKAARERDAAHLRNAEVNQQRYEVLVKNNNVTKQEYEDQITRVNELHAELDLDDALIAHAQTDLDYTTIRAPIAGRLGIRQIDQGNLVRANADQTIVVLTQLQPISVVFTIAAEAVAADSLSLGQVDVPVVALAPDAVTELDRGVVNLVDNLVDPNTGTIKLKATFPNKRIRLWPGNFVEGRIVVSTRKDGITIPMTALQHGPNGDFVWIVDKNDTVHPRRVAVQQSANGRTLVASGVKAGDLVTTDGFYRLEDGTKVEFDKSGLSHQDALNSD